MKQLFNSGLLKNNGFKQNMKIQVCTTWRCVMDDIFFYNPPFYVKAVCRHTTIVEHIYDNMLFI